MVALMIPISALLLYALRAHDVPDARGRLDGRRRHRLARPRGPRAAGEPRLRGGGRARGPAAARSSSACPRSRRSPGSTSSASTRPGRSPTARSPWRRSLPLGGAGEREVHALLGAFAASLGARNPTADALHAHLAGATRGRPARGAVLVALEVERHRVRRRQRARAGGARGDRARGRRPGARARGRRAARSSACACCCSRAHRGLAEPEGDGEPRLPGCRRRSRCVALSERMRPDAATTVAYLHRAGVEVKIISGDGPATVAAVARAAGIETEGRVTTGAELPAGRRRAAPERAPELRLRPRPARAQAPARGGARGAAAGASAWSATASTTCRRSRSATSPSRSARAASSRRAWPTSCS